MNATKNGSRQKGFCGFNLDRVYEVLLLIVVTPAIVHGITSLKDLPIA